MDSARRCVLVTGGAGYIGSHACKALATAGIEPVSYDNLEGGHRELVKWGPLEVGDLRDRERLDEVIHQYQPVAVMHFAALIAVGESVREPERYRDNNVGGSVTLLAAMADAGIRRLVFSSTAAVYGEPEKVPIPEEHPLSPVNPYGETKLEMERRIADWQRHGHGHAMVFRYFNAAGADPGGETGECHEPETHLVPLALEAVASAEPLTVFGDDYDTPDGTCIRDYIHVSDLVAAHVAGLQRLQDDEAGAVLNLGTGRGHSVREVLDAVREVTGQPVPHIIGARRDGDPPALVADPSAALELLGWRPSRSELTDIVGDAWRWYRLRNTAQATE